MNDYIGWELIYKLSEGEIHKKEDVLVLAIHYVLIQSGYRCIGIGDEKVLSGNENSTETLPPGWSKDNHYALRYVRDNNLFILRGIPSDDTVVFNFLRVSSLAVSSIVLNAAATVTGGVKENKLQVLIPDYVNIFKRLKHELIDRVKGEEDATSKEAETQTRDEPGQSFCPYPSSPIDSTSSHQHIGPRRPASVDPVWNDPERDPLRVGGADLDPLGRGQGGMIYDPFSGRGIHNPSAGLPGPPLPRGAVPPGARFDPFGPPMPGGFGGAGTRQPRPRFPPNPDHFDPPGFGDMFM